MLKEALEYFKADTAYKALFLLFKKKYESLGRIGGTVKLSEFSESDLQAISLFLGVTAGELKLRGKISLLEFEKQLGRTRFGEVTLLELLEGYFDKEIISRKKRKLEEERILAAFFDKLEDTFPSLSYWLVHLKGRTRDTFWIQRLIESDFVKFEDMAKDMESALVNLPKEFERLPMFSQRITGDPHAFDLDKILGKLLVHALVVKQQETAPIIVPADSEGLNALLLKYQILRDDIANYVTCVNLLAETKVGLHPMWEGAAKLNSVLNAPLREVTRLERIYPADGNKTVYIVENSGVYSSLVDQLPEVPLLCTHGQFNLAALLLIDLLVAEGCTLYYAGDIDPEGISMADRLIKRHPESIKPWKMDVSAYRKSISAVVLTPKRLKKIDDLTSEKLRELAAEVKRVKIAGYQEGLVGEMVEELGEF